jgi:PAS domain S-box-containing protein
MKQILIGLAVFIGLMTMTQFLAWQRHRINDDLQLQKINQEASVVKDRLKTNLSYSLSATKTLAFLVERYGEPDDFNSIAQTIIGSNKYIDALELTRKGVITHVYPPEENEAAVGFDVLRDAVINREAYRAIQKKELFFAGPFKLKQGGIAIVGRLPIFIDKNFWGFSVVLIKLSTLTKMIGADVPGKEFTYQLSKMNPNTQKEEFFLPGDIPVNKKQFVFVDVPDGEWKLYVIPKGQVIWWNDIMFPLLGLLLSVTAGVFAWSLARQPQKLNLLVDEKTREILNEKNLSASIINSLPGVFYLYDRSGKFVRWNRNFETISGYSAGEIAGMHPLQFFDGEEQIEVGEKINEVFTIGKADVRAHFYTKNKERIPYYFNGHLVRFNNIEYLIGMGIDMTEQTEAEHALRARAEEIQKLTAHLEQIREEERTRIALEIHDELGQQLTGLKMDASWIGKKLGHDELSLKEKLSSMIFLIDETVKTVRRISSELRPGILDDLGLIPALEWQCQEFEKRTQIKTNFVSDLSELNPDKNAAINIFRVYQEALTNIARHAQATYVETRLEERDNNFILTIKDNGIGFNKAEAKIKKSLGLIGMRERALTFNGDLTIDSEMNEGTTVILKVPVTKTLTSL